MTYFGFLLVFLCLPLLALAALAWRDRRLGRQPAGPWHAPVRAVLWIHVALAVVYTTPWDNYLVATRVWYYDPGRVTGLVLGWVPIEEYCFFVLQTLLAGSWLLWLARRPSAAARPAARLPGRSGPALRLATTAAASAAWLAALVALAARWQPGTYLALTLAWLLPPIMLQLAVGADVLWQQRRWVAPALLIPLLYLSAADALAIASGVWTINPARSTGIFLGVLPLEEFIFFAVTNALIVFGMTLMLVAGQNLPMLRQKLARLWRSGPTVRDPRLF